jgi:hypothetical protein
MHKLQTEHSSKSFNEESRPEPGQVKESEQYNKDKKDLFAKGPRRIKSGKQRVPDCLSKQVKGDIPGQLISDEHKK